MADISSVNLNGTSYNIKDTQARNDAAAAAQKAFKTIAANGTNIVADTADDTLTLTQGAKMSITGAASTDTITIAHYSGETAVTAGLYKVGKDQYGHVVIGDSFTIPDVGPSSTTPLEDGTAAVGTETTKFARGDHKHPTDSSRAPIASPTFTGTPKAPTASAGTNTTQIATTAFVKTAVDNAVSGAIVFKGTQSSVAAIQALTNVKQGWMYIVNSDDPTDDDNGQEWVATADIGSTASPSSWEMLGTIDVGDLGDLAYKNSASVTFTPTGTITGGVSVGSVTVHEAQISVPANSEILTITTSDKTVGASGAATSTIGFSGTEQTVSVDFA